MFNDLELHGNHFVHTLYITSHVYVLLNVVATSDQKLVGRGIRTASELTIDLISNCKLSFLERSGVPELLGLVQRQDTCKWMSGHKHVVLLCGWKELLPGQNNSTLLCTNLHIPWQQQQHRHLLSQYKKADQKLIWFVGVGACGWFDETIVMRK